MLHAGPATKSVVAPRHIIYFLFPKFSTPVLSMKLFLRSLIFIGFASVGRTLAQTQPAAPPIAVGCIAPPKAAASTSSPAAQAKARASASSTATTCAPPYYVRVNIHFIQDADGKGNFRADDDGGSANAADWNTAGTWDIPSNPGRPLPYLAPDPNYNGYKFAKQLILAANAQWKDNPQMQLPTGNNTPHPDKGIQFVLGGTYFHRDAVLYKYDPVNLSAPRTGVFSTEQFDTYGTNKANEINIFLMGQATSPALTASDAQWLYGTGVAGGLGYSANGSYLKIGNPWRIHLINRLRNNAGAVPGAMASILNHEVGHLLGLIHPFDGGNGCADTPQNLKPDGTPNPSAGNNLMDYGQQIALTPCQIGIAHNELTTNYGSYYTCNCQLPVPDFTLPQCTFVTDAYSTDCLVLDGRASQGEETYTVSVTEVGNRTLQGGGPTTIGQPTIGQPSMSQQMTGPVDKVCLATLMHFDQNKTYAVTLTLTNSCGSASLTKYLRTVDQPCGMSQESRQASATTSEKPASLYPNPTTASAGFTLLSPEQPIRVPTVRNSHGLRVSVEQLSQQHDASGWHTTYRLVQQGAQSGFYTVETTLDGRRLVQQLSVQSE